MEEFRAIYPAKVCKFVTYLISLCTNEFITDNYSLFKLKKKQSFESFSHQVFATRAPLHSSLLLLSVSYGSSMINHQLCCSFRASTKLDTPSWDLPLDVYDT